MLGYEAAAGTGIAAAELNLIMFLIYSLYCRNAHFNAGFGTEQTPLTVLWDNGNHSTTSLIIFVI